MKEYSKGIYVKFKPEEVEILHDRMKENGKVEGILAAVYQSVFGGDVYPSLEEKAANLLYFMLFLLRQTRGNYSK